jgi:hypothetical protein
MAKSRFKDARDKCDGGGFIKLPLSVLNSAAYLGLGAHARMLLFDLAAQYRGDNNGDLCAAWKLMHPRGWKSEATLDKCKRELIASSLIVETRKGARPNKCSLYALTWYALDDCGGKLDISARSFPRGAYRLKDRPPVIISSAGKNATLTTADVAGGA